MSTYPEIPPKPHTPVINPSLVRLPSPSFWRLVIRKFLRGLAWLFIQVLTRVRIKGLENFPRQGAALVVTNHLGDADVIIGLAFLPRPVEALAKIDLYFDYPLLGKLMDVYGVIWIHRGQPDRRALRAAIKGLESDRLVGIAPEGRESLIGSLETGMGGAAYLAIKTGVPVVPITFTGTENVRVYGNLKRLRRTLVSMTIGRPFQLSPAKDLKTGIASGTEMIMSRLASQLPQEYRGRYQASTKEENA